MPNLKNNKKDEVKDKKVVSEAEPKNTPNLLIKFWDNKSHYLSAYKGLINVVELLIWLSLLRSIFSNNSSEYIYYNGEVTFKSLWWLTPAFIKTGVSWLIVLAFTMVYRISPVFAILLRSFSIKLETNFNETYGGGQDGGGISQELSRSQAAEKYVQSLVTSSTLLSKDIYSRGSVYLLFGVLFSIVGLLFFYFQIHSLKFDENVVKTLITMAPNFGVLIFLEFISFFFLKQYRASMDDFRYYEAIKRSREETLAVIKLLAISDESRDYLTILESLNFSSAVGKLEAGQTTEFIETQKYAKNEMELFAKIVEAISKKQ